MMLSQNSTEVLVDLIENKLAMKQIGDREDLREVIVLQRCLAELKGMESLPAGAMKDMADIEIPRRGRRRKLSALMGGDD